MGALNFSHKTTLKTVAFESQAPGEQIGPNSLAIADGECSPEHHALVVSPEFSRFARSGFEFDQRQAIRGNDL